MNEMVARIVESIHPEVEASGNFEFELVMRERGTGTEHTLYVAVECGSSYDVEHEFLYSANMEGCVACDKFGTVETLYELTRTREDGTRVDLDFVRFA